MRVSRKALLMVLVLGAMTLMSIASVAPAGAQIVGTACENVGVRTGGDVLVDVPQNFRDGLPASAVQCSVKIAGTQAQGEAGTAIIRQRQVPDYAAVVAVDVWTANSSVAADFAPYNPPVRVCFDASEYGLDASAAVSPGEGNGPALMFSDARHYITQNQVGSYGQPRTSDDFNNNEGARNVNQLNVVPAGIADGYICGDLSWPGTISLVPGLPQDRADGDVDHPNFPGHTPDRCFVDDAGNLIGDCFD